MKNKTSKVIRYAQIAIALVALAGLGWLVYEVRHYLTTAERFEVQKLSIEGLKRIDQDEVLDKARFDPGTNVFQADLEGMRKRVETLDWVHYASVHRILPDQIIIKIVEREPIGLTRIQKDIYQFDSDGKILDSSPIGNLSFPILDGLRPGDEAGNVKKVEAYRSVLDGVGQSSLSEIHISDSGEVTVVSASDPLMVSLGTEEFRPRWIKYLQLKPQIQQRYPLAVRVDLRFKNQVIVKMNDDDAGEKVVWGARKNTL